MAKQEKGDATQDASHISSNAALDLKQDPGVYQRGDVVPLLHERRAEEWHFDEDHLKARTVALKEEVLGFKNRAIAARGQMAQLANESEEHAAKICGDVEAEDQRRAAQLSAMREEFVEVQAQIEQMREDCDQKVCLIERDMVVERETRQQTEELIRAEQKNMNEYKRLLFENEEFELEEMQSRNRKIRDSCSYAQREVGYIQRVTEQQVRVIEREARARLEALQHEIEIELQNGNKAASLEVENRRTAAGGASQYVRDVDTRVEVGLKATHDGVLDVANESIGRIHDVHKHEYANEIDLKDHIDEALMAVHCANEDTKKAKECERDIVQRRHDAVVALGGQKAFAKTTQFNMLFNIH